ncbi:TetR/AcrR family transcriptional regulator [Streptacidiphilus sp. 4-A2]|nr:TetR/AcrR family transcriptional regulator [Streptacidiphilus sp. 4-A2]
MNEADARRTAPEATRPPRPMRADARRNYERLLAVATEAFSEHGANASLDDIAKRAEVGPGTLYRHFPTRQLLLEAVVDRWLESILAEAEPLRESADPGEALARWLRRLVSHLSVFRGVTAGLLPTDGPKQSAGRVLHSIAEDLLVRAQQAGQIRPDLTVSEMTTLIYGITWACGTKPVDPDRLVDLVLDGLRTHG